MIFSLFFFLHQTYALDSGFLTTSPTFGLASRDSHQLRDDTASTDRPLETQFIETPKKLRTPGWLAIDRICFGVGLMALAWTLV